MRLALGFTLIELMVVLAIIAILTAIGYPSYQSYIQRGVRSQGQQFLMDLAQREEQYFLDNRSYAPGWVAGTVPLAGQIALDMPTQVTANYTLVQPLCQNPCQTFALELDVIAGSMMSQSKDVTGATATDGNLIVNNLQQRWRELDGNHAYNAKASSNSVGDCKWEDSHCVPG
jgi:type IV pilus assembly protein PilE